MEERLSTERETLAGQEDPSITWLRKYSNYLTPQLGLLSADTWSTVAVYLRNLFLNLLVLVSGLAVLPLLPRILSEMHDESPITGAYPLLSLALGVIATCGMGYSFASLNENDPDADNEGEDRRDIWRLQRSFALVGLVMPLLVASFLASHWLIHHDWNRWEWMARTSVAYGLAWQIAATIANFSRWGTQRARWVWPAGLASTLTLLWVWGMWHVKVAAIAFGLAWLLVTVVVLGSKLIRATARGA